jgi:hypothetical protein
MTTDQVSKKQCGVNLVGKVFGRMTVLSREKGAAGGKTAYLCRCECGVCKTVLGRYLQTGQTVSCGCFGRERAAARCRARARHGDTGAAEYEAWLSMRDRCERASHPAYARYGGRGIRVCARWGDYACFLEDMGRRPSAKHSLDRINNDGNYSCGRCGECREGGQTLNCRWATSRQQNRNRSDNRTLTHGGESLTVAEWVERSGLNNVTFRARLRAGWPLEKILATPPDVSRRPPQARRYLTHGGETLTAAEWIARTGINKRTFYGRLHMGWSIDRILATPVDAKKSHPRKAAH